MKAVSASERTVRSACFPGPRSEPRDASTPSARAPPSVASSNASAAVRASGRPSRARAPTIAARISSNMSSDGVEAGLSVAMQTRIPASRSAVSGATPQPRMPFERGQWATATSCAARISISSSSALTQCAAMTFASSSPASDSARMPVVPSGGTSMSANDSQPPRPLWRNSVSSSLSARCVATGRSSSAAAR